MRRRSERKKSTDVSSPAPAASRRTNRRRKSPSVSEDDRNADQNNEVNEKHTSDAEEGQRSTHEKDRDSSEERVDSRRSRRSSRSMRRTPVREQQQKTSPSKRRNRRDTTPDNNISPIQEEDTSTINEESKVEEKIENEIKSDEASSQSKPDVTKSDGNENDEKSLSSPSEKENLEEEGTKSLADTVDEQPPKDAQDDDESRSSVKTDKENASTEDTEDKDDQDEVKLHTRDNSPRSRSNSSDRKQPSLPIQDREEDAEDGEVIEKEEPKPDAPISNNKAEESPKKDHTSKLEEVNHNQDGKTNETSNTTAAADTGRDNSSINTVTKTTTLVRKRRWITKKASESNKEPILAISTDSLKTLIADVHPVPLSDVQLESSSDVEDVTSEREEGEQSPTPEPERRRGSIEKVEITIKRQQSKDGHRQAQLVPAVGTATGPLIQRLPSPARNQASCVLYITNLVRPFTVLQLKGLLARTGKIVEDGFWIDRIKSKCFVEYETEDEAIETRHALHGVRWPASNPKCLNVDFGNKADMLKAVESTKEEAPKFGHETNKDNLLIGTGWGRERHDDDKRGPRPVREWDVGKKENLDRDLKALKDMERRRDRSREKEGDNAKTRENDRNERDRNERERNERERRRRDRENRSRSISPARKQKKKDDPPLRLLDDLFRKTKGTPCIYWLPLTPEQIAEKEALRVKRLEEQKQRLKQREMEREKERERDRDRNRQNDRDRERDHRRPRSNERRRSRSRDRRRY